MRCPRRLWDLGRSIPSKCSTSRETPSLPCRPRSATVCVLHALIYRTTPLQRSTLIVWFNLRSRTRTSHGTPSLSFRTRLQRGTPSRASTSATTPCRATCLPRSFTYPRPSPTWTFLTTLFRALFLRFLTSVTPRSTSAATLLGASKVRSLPPLTLSPHMWTSLKTYLPTFRSLSYYQTLYTSRCAAIA